MKRTYELYCYCTKSSNGAHNTGISHAHVSFINLSWADKSATSMFIMFILVSALRNNSFIEFKLIKREEKFFARRSNKEKYFYPSRVYNSENLSIFEDSISKPVDLDVFNFSIRRWSLNFTLSLSIFIHDVFDNSDASRMREVLSDMNPAYVLTH